MRERQRREKDNKRQKEESCKEGNTFVDEMS
jgi:hypothetical protein